MNYAQIEAQVMNEVSVPAPGARRVQRKANRTHWNAVRQVDLARSRSGFGFTLSGQCPCVLSGVVRGSPASRAGLKAGDKVVAVNGIDVTEAEHDQVVDIIASTPSVLQVQIAQAIDASTDEEDDYGQR